MTTRRTDTIAAARGDARSQAASAAATAAQSMPYIPAASSPYLPPDVSPNALTWAETVPPAAYTHRVVARGTRIRLQDPTGDACAHLFLLRADAPYERLNIADTLKIPWQAYLGPGHPLLSGDGRVLATLAADTSQHHDAFLGTGSDTWNLAKYGDARPEGPTPSGQSLLTLAAAKHGLTMRDLGPTLSFFQGVRVAEDGAFQWQGAAGPGTSVDLIAELPLIVLIANVPHPLDPRPDYTVGPLRIHAWRGTPTRPGDASFTASPERTRAYLNTIDDWESRQ
ncbi:urea carboxylase-associated family protein [Catenulispora yoronensis]|uniref:Urea carboxylase-associated family protein n=1 Tax=Catenulispora yoronensis TaxID=450799 RepID=A0ABN2U701_9ACTN